MFNRDYTQYMPLLVTDLQRVVGQPALFVFDCDNAGHVMPFFTATDVAFAHIGAMKGSSSSLAAAMRGVRVCPRLRVSVLCFLMSVVFYDDCPVSGIVCFGCE